MLITANKSYYENGGIRVTGHYENDQRTGEWKQYYENGQVGETGNFVEGIFKGEGRFYYESGQLMKVFTLILIKLLIMMKKEI